MRLPTTIPRGVRTLDDLRARCIVDPVTRCWHWQGGMSKGKPVMFALDHARREKRVMPGPKAAFGIAFDRAPLPGWIVVRSCMVADCLAPYHLREVKGRAEANRHAGRSGSLKGRSIEQKRAAGIKARAAKGVRRDLSEAEVRQVLDMLGSERQVRIAERIGVDRGTVNRIARGLSYRWVSQQGRAA